MSINKFIFLLHVITFIQARTISKVVRKIACPGSPLACSGQGKCDMASGKCICAKGFGGKDCSQEVPLYLEVTSSNSVVYDNMKLVDMVGKYELQSMYLYKPSLAAITANPTLAKSGIIKFIHYDPHRQGWALSKFNSSCIDDTCFFAYAPNTEYPATTGYVYGNTINYLYNKPMVKVVDNYTVSVSYTPDPKVVESASYIDFNGDYELVPRYVDMKNKKYSIFPIDFEAPNRRWIITGLIGTPKKRKIILEAAQPLDTLSSAPLTGWLPKAEYRNQKLSLDDLEIGFTVLETCANHVNDLTCLALKGQCGSVGGDSDWIRSCCRLTCSSCFISRSKCVLPPSANLVF